ncbi:MAG: aminoacyl-tRNA hydrolase [Bacteroidetes bacterium]|nr:aminoacyl-tRNA hydrolase [Bacteroidota bacterium]
MFNRFLSLFNKKTKADLNNEQLVKYLIVGLGNIGPDYHNTRHNIGFMVVDKLAEKKDAVFTPARYGDKTEFKYKGRLFILVKPSTYMNLSGKAINYWLEKEKIPYENLLVIVDDLALPLGVLRMKTKGGDGGHNGLNSIISILGSNAFSRLRFGIGNEFHKGAQVGYVLGKWTSKEMDLINPRIEVACDAVLSFGTIGPERTMNVFNSK